MNVLFVSGGTYVDDQCDVVFHGLRTLYGAAAVDAEFLRPAPAQKRKPFSLIDPRDRST